MGLSRLASQTLVKSTKFNLTPTLNKLYTLFPVYYEAGAIVTKQTTEITPELTPFREAVCFFFCRCIFDVLDKESSRNSSICHTLTLHASHHVNILFTTCTVSLSHFNVVL